MITIGIETSCDETSICIVRDREVLSLYTYSQIDLHKVYGGVVPEIASRDHLSKIDMVYNYVIRNSGISANEIDLIAYTEKPGLIGSLLTGIMFARGLSLSLGVPAVPVDHIYGHIFTCGLTHGVYEDFLCLLISGGHTAIYNVRNINSVEKIGSTIDDSFGEVFDKLSKALGFGYPGGTIIEKIALYGDECAHKFRVPLRGKSSYDFSLSGIKTEFLKIIQSVGDIPSLESILNTLQSVPRGIDTAFAIADICASFQSVVCNIVVDRLRNILTDKRYTGERFVVCGGVASNQCIRTALRGVCDEFGMHFYAPDKELCTDNAAMIANVGSIMHEC